MKLISCRTVSFIDTQSLEAREAKEVLVRGDGGFMLYLSKGAETAAVEERLIALDAREALLWLNEDPSVQGSFWH